MDETWIKLYRSLLDWCWFKDANTLQVFIYLLLKANTQDKGFQNITVKRGELVASYASISLATGLSVKAVRVAIKHLKDTGEVASSAHPKFSVFSIENYDKFQTEGKQTARSGQGNGKVGASKGQQYKKERIKELKNEEYINKAVESFTTDEELRSLILSFYESRQSMKAPMTDKAVDMLLSKLKKYPAVAQKEALKESIMNGWKSVFPKETKSSVHTSDASYDLEAYRQSAIGLRDYVPKETAG